eukprot:scaffold7785_cov106-Isochrysis_galbana.AAC.3
MPPSPSSPLPSRLPSFLPPPRAPCPRPWPELSHAPTHPNPLSPRHLPCNSHPPTPPTGSLPMGVPRPLRLDAPRALPAPRLPRLRYRVRLLTVDLGVGLEACGCEAGLVPHFQPEPLPSSCFCWTAVMRSYIERRGLPLGIPGFGELASPIVDPNQSAV